MQKRKSHAKSKNGCTNCKQRHVKCDEGGPPCANCVVRDSSSSCNYLPGARPSPPQNNSSPSPSSSSDDQVGYHSSLNTSQDLVARMANRRILELELMHQWATSTYKGFVSTEPDIYTMQIELPKWCFKHEYLMNGLLAVSALELALTTHQHNPMQQAMYLQYAMEYYDRGSVDFRTHLARIIEENSTELYMFSTVAWVVSMATPPGTIYHYESSILERTLDLLDLVMGSSLIASESITWMMQGPLKTSFQIVIKSFAEKGEEDWVEPDAEEMFQRLAYLNDNTPESAIFPRASYKETIRHLRLVYREEMRSRIRGSAMAFLTIAGVKFSAGCKSLEPMSLMMLGVWAVMVDKLDKVDHIWWAKGGGKLLVDDITTRLLRDPSPIGTMTEYWQCLDWLRMKVDLPLFSSIPL